MTILISPDDQQRVEFLFDRRDEDIEFSDESRERRHAGERQQKDQHGGREKRRPSIQPVVIFNLIALDQVADADDDGKGAQVGKTGR